MNQKGFIPIPIIIAITFFLIIIGGGVVLYETNQILFLNNAADSFFSSTSGAIYKLIWEKKFETEMLKSELELTNIKKERAESWAEEEKEKRIEEEIAREKAEEKAQQEAIKRSQAEAKAKQEEFEKKIKEQQLADKEAEEKMMNADNDGDGLTYRRELELGTSDWDSDSDDDGIPDGEDLHPAGGGRNDAQYFEWEHDGQTWNRTFSIHEDRVHYYKEKERVSQGLNYVTANDPFIQEIAKELKKIADRKNYNLTTFVVAFVQGIPYVADFYTNFIEYPKYPIETLIERNGDCEDSTYLAASIVSATGIGIALLEFDNHMALGIWGKESITGNYFEANSKRFYYFETTGENWQLGDMPDGYKSKKAKIIQWDGKVSYGYSKYQEHACEYISEYDVYWNGDDFYWNSNCTQLVVKGCYKSKTYSGKFYKSGSAWYYDSECKQLYKSMICDYPSSYAYTCAYESSYNLKKSTCDYYKSSSYLSDLADGCYEKLAQCRMDIDEYQRKLNEYNQCKDRKEY